MATKIPTATPAYLTDFAGGQGGGISNYFTYADDHDTNYTLLRQTINQMIDEISAVSGPNATAALDALTWDDLDNPISGAAQTSGVLGAASYEVSVEGGGTLKVKAGQVFVTGQKASLVAALTGLTSSGGAGTRWVAVDVNGAVFIEALASQRALDIASVTWNGTIFTGTPTHLADVFWDGDSWAEVRRRSANAAGSFPALTYRRGANRLAAVEAFLGGENTGAEGESLAGPLIGLPGTQALPSIVLGNGVATFDTTTGWFRQAANVWGFAVSASERFRFAAGGIVFITVGSAAAPVLRENGGAGIYFPALGELGITNGTTLALRTDVQGNLDLPTNTGAIVRRAASQGSIVTATPTQISWDTEDRDVGGLIAVTATDLTIPTGGDGLYLITLSVVWATDVTGERQIHIEAAGATLDPVRDEAGAVGDNMQSTTSLVALVATDVVRGIVEHTVGVNHSIDSARLAIQKIA